MNKTRLMLILAFLATFAAGSAVAWVTRAAEQDHEPPLSRMLDLTDAQRQRIRDIWDEARDNSRAKYDPLREQLKHNRDQAIRELLGETLYGEYELIHDTYHEGMQKIDEDRREEYRRAMEETEQVLTPQQREQWQEMMTHRAERGDHHRKKWSSHRRGPQSDVGMDAGPNGGTGSGADSDSHSDAKVQPAADDAPGKTQ